MYISNDYLSRQYIYMIDQNGKYLGNTKAEAAVGESGGMSYREVMESMKNAPDGAEVAKFSLLPDFSKRDILMSGDPVQDRLVENGLKYKASCFDLTHCNEFDELTMDSDYTGMTAVEKYRAIYERYQYCFGENFLDSDAVEYVSPIMPDDDPYRRVVEMFNNEVEAACGGEDIKEIRREALYGGMNDYEIRQAITEKYGGERGHMTYRQTCKAAWAMDLCGVGGGLRNMLNPIGNAGIAFELSRFSGDTDTAWEMMLDSPISPAFLRDTKNTVFGFMQKGYAVSVSLIDSLDFMLEWVNNRRADNTL